MLGAFVASAWAETVYIRNQRLETYVVSGDDVVQADALRALLTEDEARRMSVEGARLSVRDSGDREHSFVLSPYGELKDWEEVLRCLGYDRQERSGTGVVDWTHEGSGAVTPKRVWHEPTAEELSHKLAFSKRRQGFQAAKKSFDTVMASLGVGGIQEERDRIERIGSRIVDQTPLAGLFWTFEIAATSVPNALCTGEGFVIVTQGLIDLDLDDDELAGVLGHEVAHGVRRHALLYEERFEEAERIIAEVRQLERQAARAEAAGDERKIQQIRSRLGELSPRIDLLSNFLKNQKTYNQREEEEADILGLQYAARAGFDPNGEARALVKLEARSVVLFGQAFQEGRRTHPPLKRRLEIQRLVQERWRK